MRVIETHYDPLVKNKKSRVRSKDKVDNLDRADWDDTDVRLRRLKSIERRIAEIRDHEEKPAKTPVYKPTINAWLGQVATEQDTNNKRPANLKAYKQQD